MKKFIVIAALFAGFQGYAQQVVNPKVLKEENEKLKSENLVLKQELTTVKAQNDYFRETLKIFEAKIKTVNESNIDFTILTCTGNSKTQTVTIDLLVTNKDIKRNVLFSPDSYGTVTDLQGNVKKASNIKFGAEKYATDLQTNVPTRLTIEFSGILPSVALLKAVELKGTTTNDFKTLNLLYNDISISWK